MSDPKVDLLAEALLAGELIRRYDDYARAAYPVTMKRDHEALLATDWAAHILAASPRLAAALGWIMEPAIAEAVAARNAEIAREVRALVAYNDSHFLVSRTAVLAIVEGEG